MYFLKKYINNTTMKNSKSLSLLYRQPQRIPIAKLHTNKHDNTLSKSALLWSGNVVFPSHLGGVQQGSVVINTSKGIIEHCMPGQCQNEAQTWVNNENNNNDAQQTMIEFRNLGKHTALSPGLIDVHTHISALGRNWEGEGYESATRAAAAGGITTLMSMPLNSIPPTTTPESVALEKGAAEHVPLFANVGLWGGLIPDNSRNQNGSLEALLQAGVFGLKAFLSPLPENAGYQSVSPQQLTDGATILNEINGEQEDPKPILVHSELMTPEMCDMELHKAFHHKPKTSYQAHLSSRLPQWERDAVEHVCSLTDRCPMHIVHLSDAGCLPIIERTKQKQANNNNKSELSLSKKRYKLTVETCPHYLLFDSSIIPDGETRLKCFPPIRGKSNRQDLWVRGIQTKLIDMVASDHSPCEPHLRQMDTGNIMEAWGGLSGLQYQLPATYSEAHGRGYSLSCMAMWWSENPSKLIPGLECKVGSIEVGKQADLCWWDHNYQGSPDSYQKEYHRWTGTTYYSDMTNLRGRVLGTWLRGIQVYDGMNDQHLDAPGKLLLSYDE